MVSWQIGCEMSRKEYIEDYKFMTEEVVGKIILGRTKGEK